PKIFYLVSSGQNIQIKTLSYLKMLIMMLCASLKSMKSWLFVLFTPIKLIIVITNNSITPQKPANQIAGFFLLPIIKLVRTISRTLDGISSILFGFRNGPCRLELILLNHF